MEKHKLRGGRTRGGTNISITCVTCVTYLFTMWPEILQDFMSLISDDFLSSLGCYLWKRWFIFFTLSMTVVVKFDWLCYFNLPLNNAAEKPELNVSDRCSFLNVAWQAFLFTPQVFWLIICTLGLFNRVKHDDAIVFPGFHLKTVVSFLITRNPKKGPLHCSKNFVESFHIILVKFTYPWRLRMKHEIWKALRLCQRKSVLKKYNLSTPLASQDITENYNS